MKRASFGVSGFQRFGRWWTLALCLATVVGLFAPPGASGAKLDLNAASVEELTTLEGIGSTRAQAIVARRSEAAFMSPEDLLQVPGIGERLFEQIRPHVEVVPAVVTPGSRTRAR